MLSPYRLWRRLVALMRQGRFEGDLDEELRHHLERQIGQNVAGGMDPQEARYAALRSFGGLNRAKEAALLLLLAVISGWLPARRAARVDPLIALRHQ